MIRLLVSAAALLAINAQAALGHDGLPDVTGVRLSPDGNRVVMLRPVDGALQPLIGDLESSSVFRPIRVNPRRQLLTGCDWATNHRLVCSFIKYYRADGRKMAFPGGFPARGERLVRLLAVDADGGNPLELVPRATQPARIPIPRLIDAGLAPGERIVPDDRRFRPGLRAIPTHEWEHRVLSYLPHDPDHILVSVPRQVIAVYDVYRVNIHDNSMTEVVGPHWLVAAFWSADESGRVRIAVGTDFRRKSYGHPVVLARSANGGFDRVDASHLGTTWFPPRILGYSTDGASAYVEAHTDEGRTVLWQVEATTLEVERLIADAAPYDVSLTPVRGAECGIVGFNDEFAGPGYWVAEGFRGMAAGLNAALPGKVTSIPSMSADCSRIVAMARGGGLPPTAYVHDRSSGKTRRIGASSSGLDGRFAETRRMSYQSADGYRIKALLTLPHENGVGPLPLIVMPTPLGGNAAPPHEPWVELLAAEGYAVLRPAVRGTPGRGDAHWKAGFGMWSKRLQDDMAAGVFAVVDDGVAAPDRVCYVGRGRGGYLALVGAFGAASPARCAATFGFDEPERTVFDYGTARRDWMWRHWMDMPLRFWTDASPISGLPPSLSESTARSPLLGTDRTDIPLLIAHGSSGEPALDEYPTGSRQVRRALREAGELAYSSPRGSSEEAQFLKALEDFLGRHLRTRD